MIKVRFKGNLDLSEEDVLRFHPNLKPFLDEIKSKGLKYRITNIVGEAIVMLDVESLDFKLHYYPPRIHEFEEKGKYTIEAEVGENPPAMIKVLSVSDFKVEISSEHCWDAVEVNPQRKIITYIRSVLHDFILSKEKTPKKLAEAREVYEISKFLVEEKGFKLEGEYVVEKYKELIDLFEKPYKFDLSLELTVKDEEKVPGWNELLDQLSEFFYERGLLMKLKRKKDFFSFMEKPIP